jgi:hypothetical protein
MPNVAAPIITGQPIQRAGPQVEQPARPMAITLPETEFQLPETTEVNCPKSEIQLPESAANDESKGFTVSGNWAPQLPETLSDLPETFAEPDEWDTPVSFDTAILRYEVDGKDGVFYLRARYKYVNSREGGNRRTGKGLGKITSDMAEFIRAQQVKDAAESEDGYGKRGRTKGNRKAADNNRGSAIAAAIEFESAQPARRSGRRRDSSQNVDNAGNGRNTGTVHQDQGGAEVQPVRSVDIVSLSDVRASRERKRRVS